ncbi:hypothetical protein ACIGBH_04440 [Streptomyces sp. NPDC085929]|uniref:hypothetical protein n=1 Tax=Streptomyces sp. NPDC085929 TaxID=3365739 RepID=UPI0037CD12C2
MSDPNSDPALAESSNDIAGPEVVNLIEKLLDRERAIRASAQARGLAVITTSGTLVTLLLAFAALATRRQAVFSLPSSLELPVTLASAFLVLAAVFGLISNAPRRAVQLELRDLESALTPEHWNASPQDVVRKIAIKQLSVLINLSAHNGILANILATAIAAEIVGIACTTWAVIALVTA